MSNLVGVGIYYVALVVVVTGEVEFQTTPKGFKAPPTQVLEGLY